MPMGGMPMMSFSASTAQRPPGLIEQAFTGLVTRWLDERLFEPFEMRKERRMSAMRLGEEFATQAMREPFNIRAEQRREEAGVRSARTLTDYGIETARLDRLRTETEPVSDIEQQFLEGQARNTPELQRALGLTVTPYRERRDVTAVPGPLWGVPGAGPNVQTAPHRYTRGEVATVTPGVQSNIFGTYMGPFAGERLANIQFGNRLANIWRDPPADWGAGWQTTDAPSAANPRPEPRPVTRSELGDLWNVTHIGPMLNTLKGDELTAARGVVERATRLENSLTSGATLLPEQLARERAAITGMSVTAKDDFFSSWARQMRDAGIIPPGASPAEDVAFVTSRPEIIDAIIGASHYVDQTAFANGRRAGGTPMTPAARGYMERIFRDIYRRPVWRDPDAAHLSGGPPGQPAQPDAGPAAPVRPLGGPARGVGPASPAGGGSNPTGHQFDEAATAFRQNLLTRFRAGPADSVPAWHSTAIRNIQQRLGTPEGAAAYARGLNHPELADTLQANGAMRVMLLRSLQVAANRALADYRETPR